MPPATAVSTASDHRSARAPFEFKGLSHPVLRMVLHDASGEALATALAALRGGEPGFEWEPVVIDASRVEREAVVDLHALVFALRAARLHPVAIAGAPEGWRADAERVQLGWLAPLAERRRAAAPEPDDAEAPRAAAAPAEAAAAQPAPADAAPPAPEPAEAPGAMVVNRPVRSGQQIYARGRDLVVVGDVSPGAEIIADGDVHIYGTLGGRAIAGARGRRDAVIFTLDLRAELVAVCGIYRTFEDGPPVAQAGKPVRISLEADADTLSLRTLRTDAAR